MNGRAVVEVKHGTFALLAGGAVARMMKASAPCLVQAAHQGTPMGTGPQRQFCWMRLDGVVGLVGDRHVVDHQHDAAEDHQHQTQYHMPPRLYQRLVGRLSAMPSSNSCILSQRSLNQAWKVAGGVQEAPDEIGNGLNQRRLLPCR